MRKYDEDLLSKAIVDIIKCVESVHINVDEILHEIESIELPEEVINRDFIGEIRHTKFKLTSYLDTYCEHLQTIKRNYEIIENYNGLPLEGIFE